MSTICIIPARGGSKRIPRKNIREFHGLPIISRSIQAALRANCFSDVIVSTDDQEIATVALNAGASVPFIRPAEISDDFSGTNSVIQHAIQALNLTLTQQHICCLYATAPFLLPEDIDSILKLFIHHSSRFPVFTASNYSSPIQRSFSINQDGLSDPFDIQSYNTRSQDLESFYFDAGQMYIATVNQWIDNPVFTNNALPYILDSWRVQDIDTPEDWVRAEVLFTTLQNLRD